VKVSGNVLERRLENKELSKCGTQFDRVLDSECSDRRELTAERLFPGKVEIGF
jgi:hypothetical protein